MTEFQGRRAWQLDTAQLGVTILECGGHVAAIVDKAVPHVNPLWIQNRPTIDSDQFDPADHGHLYGTDAEARLISGLAGHNLCFPFWGSPSREEEAAGMTLHGETNILRWQEVESTSNRLKLQVTLPASAIHFQREIACSNHVVRFVETATNLSAWDRPVGWCEHVTLGPPFLEAAKTRIEASLTRGFRTGAEREPKFAWPKGYGIIPCTLTSFSNRPHSDLVNSYLVSPDRESGYFVAWHPGYSLLIGYVFSRREFPWMNVWESNDSIRQTRGMEFSNTPIDGTMRELVKQSAIWNVPVYDWLSARGQLSKRYAAFITKVPEDFQGVADVVMGAGKLDVIESVTARRISLAWEPETE